MKTPRFRSAVARRILAGLAGLLVAAESAAAGPFTLHVGGASLTFATDSQKLAHTVAEETRKVRETFDEKRQNLAAVTDPDGASAFLVKDVSGLIAGTGRDLDKALDGIGEPRLKGLTAWADEELANLLERLATYGPVQVAQTASLGAPPPPAATPKPATVPAGTADQLLDEAKAVIERIFVLASNDDLEVKLWVGSTPAEGVTFRFWPQGQILRSTPATTLVKTNGKRDHVLRGLYFYRASRSDGSVAEVIAYPGAATAGNGLASERLDLVNGSRFFCCRFNESYCQHVDSEKECRP